MQKMGKSLNNRGKNVDRKEKWGQDSQLITENLSPAEEMMLGGGQKTEREVSRVRYRDNKTSFTPLPY